MNAFNKCFEVLIGNEGGYVFDKRDPGGETNFGITKRIARANGYTGEMKDLSLAEAKIIAKKCYWDICNCDALNPAIAFNVFDVSFNGGYAIKWLQLSAGLTPTGKLDSEQIDIINKTDPFILVAKFNAFRILYYTSLKTFKDFGKGWTNRIAHNLMQIDKIK